MISLPRTAFALLLSLIATELTAQADFYVATDGKDENPGTRSKPFAKFERARQAVRDVKSQRGLPRGGLTVWLRGGDYPRSTSFELTAADAGTAQAPISWEAYRDERVRLLGGRVVTGFRPITDPVVIGRLDEKARDNVLVADLAAHGITDFGALDRADSDALSRPRTVSCSLQES